MSGGILGWFDNQLAESGYVRMEVVSQPSTPDQLTRLTVLNIKDQYAGWIRFYQYLSNEMARLEGAREMAKLNVKTSYSAAYVLACLGTEFTNDAGRRASAESSPEQLAALTDAVGVTALYKSLLGRQKMASKTMDWLGRELYSRTGQKFHQDSSTNRTGRPEAYKPPVLIGVAERSRKAEEAHKGVVVSELKIATADVRDQLAEIEEVIERAAKKPTRKQPPGTRGPRGRRPKLNRGV